jgi:hypothetical protein
MTPGTGLPGTPARPATLPFLPHSAGLDAPASARWGATLSPTPAR